MFSSEGGAVPRPWKGERAGSVLGRGWGEEWLEGGVGQRVDQHEQAGGGRTLSDLQVGLTE